MMSALTQSGASVATTPSASAVDRCVLHAATARVEAASKRRAIPTYRAGTIQSEMRSRRGTSPRIPSRKAVSGTEANNNPSDRVRLNVKPQSAHTQKANTSEVPAGSRAEEHTSELQS